MAVIVKVEARQLPWNAERTESGRFVATCPPMKLVTEADSLDELYSIINETMQLMLVDLLRDNELPQFLIEHGWQADVPVAINPADVQFNVPWQLIVQGANDSARRAH